MLALIAQYKKISFILTSVLLLGYSTSAKNYYVSNSGNDSNDGLSISTPWQSLSKVSSFTGLTAGDSVLFNCGDIFYGTLVINNSGSSANPIIIGAYGTGPNPVITGFTTITDWANLGGNIWESTNAVSTLPTCNMVVINGVNTAMGRYPNQGYLTYQSFTSTSITSSSLNSSITDWTGAIAVIRKNNFIIDFDTVKSQSGTVLTHSQHSAYNGTANYGFFIENDSRTLDTANEWYYNSSTKKLRIYSTSMPANVQISTIDSLVKVIGRNNVTFTNISFTGSNTATFAINFSHHPKILNCNIDFAGINAIITRGGSCDSAKIINCTINHSNNKAIDLGGASPNCLVSYTTIKNTGINAGMTPGSDGTFTGVLVNSDNSIVENCIVDSTGYIAIGFYGNNTIIRNNFVTNYCQVKHDGGALYSFVSAGGTPFTGEQVLNNIIMNGNSSTEGTTEAVAIIHGIYFDGNANVEVSGNTAANCAYAGIYIHNAYNLNIHNNTGFNNGLYQTLFASFATGSPIRNDIVNNNIFVSKDSSQLVASFQSVANDISGFGTIDSNYYARPIDDNVDFYVTINNYTNFFNYTLAQWQAYSGFDSHSHKSPKTITTLNDLRFEYNATSVSKTIPLDGYYIDVKNVSYNGTITLAPFTSAVLIRNIPPIASAGPDQLITLPINTVNLSGSGTDIDGSISSYHWTEVSGATQGTITNADSASTSVIGLVQGVYQFELDVTDNNGATGKDTMQVTVNVPPTANAGPDQLITLPTNTVALSGSGNDPDGTIASYNWTSISGPTLGTITNTAAAITSVTGLVQGVYQFELDVTDNNGAIGKDTVQVIVNTPPTANAGPDQLITLPTNTVALSGSGTDADGTVSTYNWTEISGPESGAITNPGSASTTVTDLVGGIYQFELDVTDNNGAIGKDTVQVIVNTPPTANAGPDQLITLPTNTVALLGSGTDADGTVSTYNWTKISGPESGAITNPGSASTTVTGLVGGVYQFELDVTDNNGAIGKDTVQVTVNAPPTANAGPDQLITLPINTVTLTGSGTDPDGTIASYNWTEISGPAGATITSPTSAVTSVTGLVQGVYQFELDVTDNSGAIGSATVQITVNAVNIPPTANAGTDQSITLPVSTVTLTGSGTDPDGTIASYNWTETSGPAGIIISNPTSAITSVIGLVQGVYQFELDVTDNNGAIGSANVQITVNAANIPPTSNAGADQLITLPTNTVTLSGSGNDPDGTISAYNWTKISGPSSGTINSASSASTTVTALVQGVYKFQLTVTDNNGATGVDTVQITVNVPPTANAGADQLITLPSNTVTLSGSGSDVDGTISAYSWTKISGPSSGSITNASSASTTVTALVQGVYQFQLKVTDNNGATGVDTVQITVNVPPTANAGTDQLITLPINTVTLTGSGSDVDGTISAYNWIKVSGPSSGSITNASSASTTVTALVQGVYQFQLKVTDNNGATGADTVQITVNPANIPPTANAGPDQLITLPSNTVTLSGSGSDVDGTISAYSWTKISGPSSGSITNASSTSTTVTALVQGVYKFQLTVTDNNGATGVDTVQITVNVPPTANAGADQLITLPSNTVTLSGSGSDVDGTISAYNWTKISGPSSGSITNASSASTTVTALVQGVYQFQLKVTDNNGATGADTVQITVNPANIPPTANAGPDQLITLPTNTVTLTGSGNDPDGTISAYSWTKLSGSPASGTITNASSASTTVTALVQGVYQFQLKVTDNNGATGVDTVQITVNPANIPPTANAGPDQLITLPTNTVTLSGSGTDIDGTISAYNWTKVSGPSSGSITNASSASTTVTALVQGVYQFQLKVTDNNGATGVDTVQITVNPANIPPTANAGPDQLITLPSNTVTLSGSGSDVDGTISAYNWTKISGPSSGSITNASSASTTVTALVQGVYQFQLKVTDNNGATGVDTVQITVNVPPTANAGTDQLITLPINTVTLTGSGSDVDGTISAYNWIKVSGPSSGTITNASLASTTVTALVQGVYKFQLTVTDNNGATGVDTVQITVNVPPTANAGADQLITLPSNTVTLSGSGSDVDGTISAYSWTKISGPSSGSITNASSASTTVTALVQGVYQFQLKVTDNNGATGVDTVQITVNPANIPPTANAGPDQLITLPTNTVILSGSGKDVDGTISAYSWTKLSGSPASGTITNAGLASTTVTGLVKGVYKFQLKVTDNNGATGVDTVQITVNTPPTANAGPDQLITLPTNTVTLTGTGTDVDGTISSYNWTKVSGPAAGTITNANSASTTVTALVNGVYKFQLKVTDNYGATGVDTVQITVNVPPTANAGPDQLITLPTNSVTLSGSGSDPNGIISAYKWTKISGSTATITNASSATTTVTALVKGVYKFQLKVTDNNGATGVDTVQVTVNVAPVANAGPDQLITLPTNTVTLSGSGTDADGTIAAYNWTKIAGPSSGTIANASLASTTVTALVQGVYKFQLKVTDNNGATGVDTVQITVNAPPTANAGLDQSITLPTSTVTLSGSGTDVDGTISAYKWTKLSGSPSSGTITSSTSASTTVTSLVQGVYKFQLKVTDNNGATGVDTVQVTVNPAANIPPTANAGPDQSITLPTNKVTLTGSGTDPDGTISAYNWTKISGPAATIASPNSKTTSVSGLVQGVYKFQLMVTDNKGATGKDTMQVTVNPAASGTNLVTFSAQPAGDNITLTWETTNETNVSGFDIEKKAADTWEKMGYLQSAGGISKNHYSFNDYLPVTGLNYYRLKMLGSEGGFIYSDIINVKLENVLHQNVPNPFSNTTTIPFEVIDNSLVKIVVYDALGTPVAVLVNAMMQRGSYQVQWNAGNIVSGTYFYTIVIGYNIRTMKMLKLN